MSARKEKDPPRAERRTTKRAAAKEEQILAGARQVFMQHGFEGAAIDEIARVAGVSKPTLYRYFPDKRHLYAAIFARECDRHAAELFPADLDGGAIDEVLRRIARSYLNLLLSPAAQGAFRVSIGDAQRFPELSRAFYHAGPGRGTVLLQKILAAHVATGELEIDDLPLAAAQFLELSKSDLFYKNALSIIDDVTPEEIERVVAGAVEVFLRAYGTQPRR